MHHDCIVAVLTSRRHLRVYKPCSNVDNDKAVTHIATPLAHTPVELDLEIAERKNRINVNKNVEQTCQSLRSRNLINGRKSRARF